jgi:hypothetical protein
MANKTLNDLVAEHKVFSDLTQQAFRSFMESRTIANFEKYREAKYKRNECLALIQSY